MRLVIAEKGLACEERDVSLPQSEHKEPWFMRLNLGEEVPVIIHRDNIISDYDQIIDYVERTFTGGMAAAPTRGPAGSDGVPEPWEAFGNPLEPWARLSLPQDESRAQIPPRNCIATDLYNAPTLVLLQRKGVVQTPSPLKLWGYGFLPQEL